MDYSEGSHSRTPARCSVTARSHSLPTPMVRGVPFHRISEEAKHCPARGLCLRGTSTPSAQDCWSRARPPSCPNPGGAWGRRPGRAETGRPAPPPRPERAFPFPARPPGSAPAARQPPLVPPHPHSDSALRPGHEKRLPAGVGRLPPSVRWDVTGRVWPIQAHAAGQWGEAAGDRAAPLCPHQTSSHSPDHVHEEGPEPPTSQMTDNLQPSPPQGSRGWLRPPSPPFLSSAGSGVLLPQPQTALSFGLGSKAWRAGGHIGGQGPEAAEEKKGPDRGGCGRARGWGPGAFNYLKVSTKGAKSLGGGEPRQMAAQGARAGPFWE